VKATGIVTSVLEARRIFEGERATGRTVGLVPTMGSLHAGHRSLMDRAVAERDVTVVTVFVNPLQFAAHEDLDSYPSNFEADTAMCTAAGVDWLLAPTVAEMYPRGVPPLTSVSVAELGAALEGASRPTHFAGVATVVAKLFAIAGPCRAYFGEKDWQQLMVVRRMAADLSFPVDVVGCPTVREPDGLAESSRNAYLDPAERAAAPVLIAALRAGSYAIAAGERDRRKVSALIAELIDAEPLARLDYAEVVQADTLRPVDPLAGELRLLAAAQLGRARLIDNVGAVAST